MPEGYFSLLHILILLFSALFLFGVPLLIAAFLVRRSDERARNKGIGNHQIPSAGLPSDDKSE